MTSRAEERVTRVRTADCTSASATVGRISERIARIGSDQPGKPPGGSQRSLTAKSITRRIESQKAGMAMPSWLRNMTPPVAECAMSRGGADAEGEGDDQGQHHAGDGERNGHWKALADQRRHGDTERMAYPEIAVQRVPDPMDIARQQRLIEAELFAQGRKCVIGGIKPEDGERRIARQHVHHGKDHHRHGQQVSAKPSVRRKRK